MFAYRDGSEIFVCDGCHETIKEKLLKKGWPKETTWKGVPWPVHFHSPECKKRYRKPQRAPEGALRT